MVYILIFIFHFGELSHYQIYFVSLCLFLFFFKLRLQDLENVVDIFLFEFSSAHEFLTAQCQYAPRCIAADLLQLVQHPLFDLICEFIEIDIKVAFFLICTFTIYIYLKSYEARCQFDIHTTLADGQRYLVRVELC